MKAYRIIISGITQGVGFRPFIYRIAKSMGLRGYVRNMGGAEVEVFVEGLSEPKIFVDELLNKKPPPAEIDEVVVEEVAPRNFSDFRILRSGNNRAMLSQIPPDIAICENCLREIDDPNSRFYRYPFHSCAWCGPRFSMMFDIPYDRENTAMEDFPMCNLCLSEYNDPSNIRRFHAQGISCPICGPKLWVVNNRGEKLNVIDPITFIAKKIDSGHIIAIKGIGGFHIAALATDDDVVAELRKRKNRPQKPFALMVQNLDVAKKIVHVDKHSESVLLSPQRPIVLLPKRENTGVSELVAPGLDMLGIMIAYSGIHYLLLKETRDKYLIMTSGNPKGKPICTSNAEALARLGKFVDYFLLHNRKIINRVDDSVVRFSNGELAFLRRSRGLAPTWIKLRYKASKPVVAFGAELQNVAGVLVENRAILTQYLGDMDDLENLEFLESALRFLIRAYKVDLSRTLIVADKHPLYLSRRLAEEYAEKYNAKIICTQHHKAHIASVLAEKKIGFEERIVGIAIDGTGFGDDGAIWGGEVFFGSIRDLKRVGRLKYVPMPGGDLAVKYPLRMLIGILSEFLAIEEIRDVLKKIGVKTNDKELVLIYRQAKSKNVPKTSSLGRVLDSISAYLGVCRLRTYEGEPAIKLEAFARGGKLLDIDIPVYSQDGFWVVDTPRLFEKLLESNADPKDLALTTQYALGFALGKIAKMYLDKADIKCVFVSGGASVNDYLLRGIEDGSQTRVCSNTKVPRGDGGIALGQLYLGLSEVYE